MSGLRDSKTQFDDSNAQVLGVSLDDLETQTKFAESLKLPFPLLSDKGGKAATAYGVKGAMWANRTTFVIDETGRIITILEGKDAIDPAATVAACGKPKPSSP
jgi:peroxiredoxin Q/BCP